MQTADDERDIESFVTLCDQQDGQMCSGVFLACGKRDAIL
jgi:hypothetical protein